MARQLKRSKEHAYLARIDQRFWDEIVSLRKAWGKGVSLNDVLNTAIDQGLQAMKEDGFTWQGETEEA